jgi:DNA-binding NtrC family response regulator
MPDTAVSASRRTAQFTRPSAAPAELVGRSAAIARVLELVQRAALATGGTLITGEPGVDAEAVAREIHERSRESASAYVIAECDSGDPATVDRLLFGEPTPQAPSDLESVASDSRVAAARGGTLFLQNVSELPAAAQARLARIARDGEVRIDGVPVPTALRLVASASPGIDAEVHAHRFRSDLCRRLSAARIDLPPLRERAEDVPALALRVLDELCAAEDCAPRTFTQAALALVGALTWPGNLAELRHAIARVVANTPDDVIQIEHLLPALHLNRAPAPFLPAGNLRDARQRFERDYIAAVLQHHGWRMSDAAQTLGIQRPNLYRKARQLGIPLARLSE